MSKQQQLTIGDAAPDFTLQDQHGNSVSLASYRGKKVILFAYPAAMTPGCTKEACDFRDSLEPLRIAGYEILGISPDAVEKLAKFTKRDSLNYPLLSDPTRETLAAYGAFGEKKNYGRVIQGVIRSTFAIDEDGKIALALYNVRATGHVARVLTQLGIAA